MSADNWVCIPNASISALKRNKVKESKNDIRFKISINQYLRFYFYTNVFCTKIKLNIFALSIYKAKMV